ncbi:MAG: ATP-dependent DNA helicase [Actinomycetota bacterium]|nr:ATP-dependent DNA helicase [Actinomycetota bacterium]
MSDVEPTVESLLAAVVAKITGDQAVKPRAGQLALAKDIDAAMHSKKHAVANAPTGVGKSFASLVPAALAACRDERTVISTESLALMDQIVHKDGPVVAEVCRDGLGLDLQIASLKGMSNYACPREVATTAQAVFEATGRPMPGGRSESAFKEIASKVRSIASEPSSALLAPPTKSRKSSSTSLFSGIRAVAELDIDGTSLPRTETLAALSWAADQVAAGDPQDRDAYTGDLTSKVWKTMSTSSAECPGATECSFGEVCLPQKAKDRAAEADILVTNHSMVAVQAAKAAPVLTSQARLGLFRHLVIDEAHALPSQVRGQGESTMSALRLQSVVRAVARTLDDADTSHQALLDRGRELARALESEIRRSADPAGKDKVLPVDADPLTACGGSVDDWLTEAKKEVERQNARVGENMSAQRRIRSAVAAIESLAESCREVRKGRFGHARWVGIDRFGDTEVPAVKTTPVDVAAMLAGNVWTSDVPTAYDANQLAETGSPWVPLLPEEEWSDARPSPDGRGMRGRYRLSVSALSATLPAAYAREAGLSGRITEYASPFETAYANSMLFIPPAWDPADVASLSDPRARRPRLDQRKHVEWAAAMASELVEANGGAALVLSANSEAGRRYAQALQAAAAGRWNVLSQWDGQSRRSLIERWRADESCVLVGTRSFATGVDGPGRTCSLVVIDRPPRSAGNPVDDARVDAIAEALQIDRWSADRHVYVSDAAVLLEQSAGRLIRAVGDTGMVACLDPRMLKKGPLAYQEQTRQAYMKPLRKFGSQSFKMDEALNFLRGARSSASAA